MGKSGIYLDVCLRIFIRSAQPSDHAPGAFRILGGILRGIFPIYSNTQEHRVGVNGSPPQIANRITYDIQVHRCGLSNISKILQSSQFDQCVGRVTDNLLDVTLHAKVLNHAKGVEASMLPWNLTA